jgi:hypothetical protein
MQGYGDDHLFETRSQPGGGFTVLIEIPYETGEEAAGATAAPEQAQQETPLTGPDASPPSDASTGNVININPQRAIGTIP